MSETVNEQYEIKFNRPKDDGFWEYGCEEEVWVKSSIYREKDNHAEAERQFMLKHPDCVVVRVTYC